MKKTTSYIFSLLLSVILLAGCTEKRIAETNESQKNVQTDKARGAQSTPAAPSNNVRPLASDNQSTGSEGSTSNQGKWLPTQSVTSTTTEETNASPSQTDLNQEGTVILFGFNKRDLTKDMKETLDALSIKLLDLTPESITITGHADHLEGGGNTGNIQKLSEVRASLVKDYLVRKKIPELLIKTHGKGRSEPQTQKGECDGPLSRQTLICLQPDRRVEINIP